VFGPIRKERCGFVVSNKFPSHDKSRSLRVVSRPPFKQLDGGRELTDDDNRLTQDCHRTDVTCTVRFNVFQAPRVEEQTIFVTCSALDGYKKTDTALHTYPTLKIFPMSSPAAYRINSAGCKNEYSIVTGL